VIRPITYLAVAAALGGAIALAGPSSANPIPPAPTVVVSTDNGVRVGATWNDSPIVGVRTGEDGVCFGVSLQTTHCVPVQLQKP
jgi:hypothetical protein